MEAGADAIGLNFFQKSKRSVDAQAGASIVNKLRSFAESKQTPASKTIGVFVNHSIQEIVALATQLKLDGIQLHGDETIGFFGDLKPAIEIAFEDPNHRPFYIRAVRTQPAVKKNKPADRGGEIQRVKQEIADWTGAGVDLILLDAASAKEFGGTGKTIDWTLVPNFQSEIQQPIVLAGGLTPINVCEAIQISQVKIVDTASGVESEPGVKLKQSVIEFVNNAKAAYNQ